MTTTITKEQLRAYAEKKVNSLRFAIKQSAFTGITEGLEKELHLAEYALTAMDAEPVAWVCAHGDEIEYNGHNQFSGGRQGLPLYAAPPAAIVNAEPVGEVSEQPDGLVMDGTVHLGGSRTHRVVKGLNKMKRLPLGTKFYTAPPAPVSIPGELTREEYKRRFMEEHDFDDTYRGGWEACRAAMLQCSEQPQNVQQNIPEIIPATQFKPVADLYALCWQPGDVVTYTPEPEKAAIWLNNYSGTCVKEYVKLERLQNALTGNYPVIPNGWKLVPVNATRAMIDAAARVEEDGYDAMHKAMIAAAPQYGEKS